MRQKPSGAVAREGTAFAVRLPSAGMIRIRFYGYFSVTEEATTQPRFNKDQVSSPGTPRATPASMTKLGGAS